MSAPITPPHPDETAKKDMSKWTFLFFGLGLGTATGMIFVLTAWGFTPEPTATTHVGSTSQPTVSHTYEAPAPYGDMCDMGEREIEQIGDTICVENKLYAEIENKAQALLAKKLHAGQRDAEKWAERQDLKPNSIDGLWKYLCSAKPSRNGQWYASSQLRADYTFDYTFGLNLEFQGFYMTLEVPNEELTASEVCLSYPEWLPERHPVPQASAPTPQPTQSATSPIQPSSSTPGKGNTP